jgi:hypothetical protein
LNTSPVNASVANFAGATDNPNDPGNSATAGVSGSLSETLLLAANSSVDYVESVTFGDTITFDVTLSGPGVDPTGNAGNSSGTTLVLDVLNSTQSAYLFSSDPDGTSTSASDPLWAVGVINVDPTGTLSMTENPNEGGVVSDLTLTPTGNVPEPSVCLLSGAGLVALALLVRRKYRYA